MTSSLHYLGIGQLGERIRQRDISPVDVVRASLERIEQLQPKLNAFITVLADEATEQAKVAEAEIAAGNWRGPLHGIAVGIKDMYDTAGVRTTAAFEHFRNRIPAADAAAVARLKAAGAIIIGKTNLHELAMGTTSVQSYFGPVRNPWNPDFIAGGSSGGSAAAVAAGMCYATLDTDAIGSCRLPASCCGVVGFKGTYRLIDNTGILDGEPVDEAILWLAHAAITTRDAADTALVLNVLAEGRSIPTGEDDLRSDATSDGKPVVGVVTNFAASDAVGSAFDAAVATLRRLGHTLRDVEAPLENPGFDVRHIEADRRAVADSLFSDVEVLVLPTTTAGTPTIDDAAPDPQALSARNTLFANYYGLPAISIPCALDARGLPLGLQIVGRAGDDRAVLRVAHEYQRAGDWLGRHPIA